MDFIFILMNGTIVMMKTLNSRKKENYIRNIKRRKREEKKE